MTFLEYDDFLPIIKGQNLAEITEATPAIIDTIEAVAISEVTSYLYNLYDTEDIFSTTGMDRNAHVVQMVASIVLYYLYLRLPKAKMPETRADNYETIIKFLESVRDAKNALPLPKKIIESEPATQVRWVSNPPRRS